MTDEANTKWTDEQLDVWFQYRDYLNDPDREIPDSFHPDLDRDVDPLVSVEEWWRDMSRSEMIAFREANPIPPAKLPYVHDAQYPWDPADRPGSDSIIPDLTPIVLDADGSAVAVHPPDPPVDDEDSVIPDLLEEDFVVDPKTGDLYVRPSRFMKWLYAIPTWQRIVGIGTAAVAAAAITFAVQSSWTDSTAADSGPIDEILSELETPFVSNPVDEDDPQPEPAAQETDEPQPEPEIQETDDPQPESQVEQSGIEPQVDEPGIQPAVDDAIAGDETEVIDETDDGTGSDGGLGFLGADWELPEVSPVHRTSFLADPQPISFFEPSLGQVDPITNVDIRTVVSDELATPAAFVEKYGAQADVTFVPTGDSLAPGEDMAVVGFRIDADLTDPDVCGGMLLNMTVNIGHPGFGPPYVASERFPGEYYAGGHIFVNMTLLDCEPEVTFTDAFSAGELQRGLADASAGFLRAVDGATYGMIVLPADYLHPDGTLRIIHHKRPATGNLSPENTWYQSHPDMADPAVKLADLDQLTFE